MRDPYSNPPDDSNGAGSKSNEPAYAKVVDILRGQIAAGVYRPGDRLPSEAELCERYQLSRMTVRKVLGILAEEGAVQASQGKGTFVRPWALGAASFHLSQLHSVVSDEDVATVKILEASIKRADARIARKLDIKINDRVVYIRRLLYVRGEPVIYHREYLICDPTRPLVETEMEVTSLHGFFDGSDAMGLKCGELSVEVAILNEEEIRLLNAPNPGAFHLEHIFYDYEDRPTSWGWFLCRGDRLRFQTTVGVARFPKPDAG